MSQQKISVLTSLLCSKIPPGSPVPVELISNSLTGVLDLLSSLQPGKAPPSPLGPCLSSTFSLDSMPYLGWYFSSFLPGRNVPCPPHKRTPSSVKPSWVLPHYSELPQCFLGIRSPGVSWVTSGKPLFSLGLSCLT